MRIFFVVLLGALTGAILTAVFGPQLITWWGTPPVRTSCDCSANIAWGLNHLVWAQLIFTVFFAFLFLALYLVLFRRRRLVVSA